MTDAKKDIVDTFSKLIAKLPLVVIPTKYGILITPPISPKAQMMGTYEDSAFAIIESTLRSGDVFVDVGAYAGYYTISCAKLIGKKGKVIAFEPNLFNYKVLCFNISLNRLKNVIAVRSAVFDFDGRGRLSIPRKEGISLTDQGSLVHRSEVSINVPLVMLDTFLERIEVQPDIVKIDVEGAELNVIKGGLRTLAKGVKLVVIESHTAAMRETLVELLSKLGYVAFEESKFLLFTHQRACTPVNIPSAWKV